MGKIIRCDENMGEVLQVSSGMITKYPVKKILDIPVTAINLSQIAPYIVSMAKLRGKKTIFGLNAYNLNLTIVDDQYREILQRATTVYPEGIGVVLASKILSKGLPEKTTLMDFIYDLLALAAEKGWSLYIVGGKGKIAQKAKERLNTKFPKLKIVGFHNGYFKKDEETKLINSINKGKPTFLFVALGSPQQEKWIAEYMSNINAKIFLGIGGSIDIIAGTAVRAPSWMNKVGLEWLYRFFREPKRLWKRYLVGNILFLFLVLSEILRIRLFIQKILVFMHTKALALILLVLSAPLWPILYIAVKLTSKGPFIFKQKRVGKDMKVFTIYKVRTMVQNAGALKSKYKHLNEVSGPVFKIRNDPRHTVVGRFISYTGLDEFPQLINVLKGDMELVGPRPLPVYEAAKIPIKYQDRFSVLPGMTSPWVIKGAHKLSFNQWMKLDVEYTRKKSLAYDIDVLLNTILLVIGLTFFKRSQDEE